jgi:hypothetical protein
MNGERFELALAMPAGTQTRVAGGLARAIDRNNGGLTLQQLAIAITADQRLFVLNFVAGIKEVWEYQPRAHGNALAVLFDGVVNPPLQFVNNFVPPFGG